MVFVTGCGTGRSHASAAVGAKDAGTGVAAALYRQHSEWKGVGHKDGGLSKSGIDCAGLVYLTFKQYFGLSVPRNTRALTGYGKAVSRKKLDPGDLVFFKTGMFKRHVGIYIEDGKFLHASKSQGVMISSLNDAYWDKRFWKARRVL